MILIISLMLAGMALGFAVLSRERFAKAVKLTGRIQQVATALLLFLMGLWLGGNNEFGKTLK